MTAVTRQRMVEIATWIGAVTFLAGGAWAMVAPRSFFDRAATFEPYNQHLLQDIGAFQIGIGVVLALAATRPALTASAVALLGSGVGAAAHVVSHVIGHDLGGRPATDIPSFSLIALLLLAAGGAAARTPSRGPDTESVAPRSGPSSRSSA